MKKLIAAVAAALFAVAFVSTAFAEAAVQTIKGEAVCAKCELHTATSCQTAIKVKNGDKETIYYAVANDVAKKFHGSVCQAPAKVTATGTVEEKDGKKYITLKKIVAD